MAKKKNYESTLDMTPMIDCVFQLMIFFIVTFKLDDNLINENIELAKSPHGPAIEKRAPGTMIIEVDKKGIVTIGRVVLNDQNLHAVLQNQVNRIGASRTEILIRADMKTQHFYVRKVMDHCSAVGIWKIKFAALKKKGQ